MHQLQKERLSAYFSLVVIELIWINVDSDSEKGIVFEFLIANMLKVLCIIKKGTTAFSLSLSGNIPRAPVHWQF